MVKRLLEAATDAADALLRDDPTLSAQELHDALADQRNSVGVVVDAGDLPSSWREIAECDDGLTELVNMAVAKVITGSFYVVSSEEE